MEPGVQCHLPGALSTPGLPIRRSAADRGSAYERPRVVGPVQPDDKHGAVHKNALDMVEWEMLLQGLAAAQRLEGALPRAAALVVLHAKHSADDVHLDLAGAAGVVHGRLFPGLVSLHDGC